MHAAWLHFGFIHYAYLKPFRAYNCELSDPVVLYDLDGLSTVVYLITFADDDLSAPVLPAAGRYVGAHLLGVVLVNRKVCRVPCMGTPVVAVAPHRAQCTAPPRAIPVRPDHPPFSARRGDHSVNYVMVVTTGKHGRLATTHNTSWFGCYGFCCSG